MLLKNRTKTKGYLFSRRLSKPGLQSMKICYQNSSPNNFLKLHLPFKFLPKCYVNEFRNIFSIFVIFSNTDGEVLQRISTVTFQAAGSPFGSQGGFSWTCASRRAQSPPVWDQTLTHPLSVLLWTTRPTSQAQYRTWINRHFIPKTCTYFRNDSFKNQTFSWCFSS